jgi:hypothetical protein
MRTVALIVLLTLLPSRAWGDTVPVVPVPSGEDRIEVVKKGDPAPFTGQLFDQPTALRWANYLQQYKFRLQADVEFQKKYDGLELDYAKKQLELERAQYTQVTGDLQKKLDAAQKELAEGPPWYKTTGFGVAIGVLVTVAAAAGTAALINAAK